MGKPVTKASGKVIELRRKQLAARHVSRAVGKSL